MNMDKKLFSIVLIAILFSLFAWNVANDAIIIANNATNGTNNSNITINNTFYNITNITNDNATINPYNLNASNLTSGKVPYQRLNVSLCNVASQYSVFNSLTYNFDCLNNAAPPIDNDSDLQYNDSFFITDPINAYNIWSSTDSASSLSITGTEVVAIGDSPGYQNTGSEVVTLGDHSGYQNTGSDVVIIGDYTGFQNTGNSVVHIGAASGYVNNATDVVSIGSNSGYQNNGSDTVMLGFGVGNVNNANYAICIGFYTCNHNQGSYSIMLGQNFPGNPGNGNGGYGSNKSQLIIEEYDINQTPLIQGDFVTGQLTIPTLILSNQQGIGNAFACFDSTGTFYRNDTSPCQPIQSSDIIGFNGSNDIDINGSYINASDYPSIQVAVNSTNGQKIVISKSETVSTIILHSNISIECLPNVTLTLSSGYYLFMANDITKPLDNVEISNCNIVNGGIWLQGAYFGGFTHIIGNTITAAPEHGIRFSEWSSHPLNKKVIENNHIVSYGQATLAFGIYNDYDPNTYILNNLIDGWSNYDAIEMGNLGHIYTIGNTITNFNSTSELQFPFSSDSIIEDNVVYNGTIQNDANIANNVTISHNYVFNASADPNFAGITARGKNEKIIGNTVTMGRGSNGIRVYQGDNSIIADNHIYGNGTTNTSTLQCILTDKSDYVDIHDNQISNCYRGIGIEQDNNNIHNNLLKNLYIGLYFSQYVDSAHFVLNTTVTGNDFGDSIQVPVFLQGGNSNTNTIYNNLGLSPFNHGVSLTNVLPFGSGDTFYNGTSNKMQLNTIQWENFLTLALPNSDFINSSNNTLFLPFNETVGTTASDYSGNSNNGTLYNFSFNTTSGWNNGLMFNGFDNHVSIPTNNSLNMSNDFSISVWVYSRSYGTYQEIISKAISNGLSNNNYELRETTGNGEIQFVADGGTGIVASGVYGDLNTWNFITVTWNNTNHVAKLYKDGVYKVINDTNFIPSLNGNNVTIGNRDDNFTNSNMVIYDLNMYDVELSGKQVLHNYVTEKRPSSYLCLDSSDSVMKVSNACSPISDDDSTYLLASQLNMTFINNLSTDLNKKLEQSNFSTCANNSFTAWNGTYGNCASIVSYVDSTNTSMKGYVDAKDNSIIATTINYSTIPSSVLTFNGTNGYIKSTNNPSLNITNNISITGWIQPFVVSGFQVILAKSQAGTTSTQYEFRLNGQNLEFVVTDGSVHTASYTTAFTANNWYFVTAIDNNNALSVYVNGIVGGTTATVSGTQSTTAEVLTIGARRQSSPSLFFNGNIDEIKLYNRVLSLSEIQSSQNNTYVNRSGIVGEWHMNEQSGLNVFDSSNSDNHGTLIGNFSWNSSSMPLTFNNELFINSSGTLMRK